MKLALFSAVLLLAHHSAESALIGWWKQDELTGPNIVDATGQNPEAAQNGSPIYGTPGVPNGVYGSIVVGSAQGTSIGYGPSTADATFITGTTNENPVMDIDATGQLTVMGWLRPAAPELTTAHVYRMLSTGSAAGGDFGWGLGLRWSLVNNVLEPFARFTAYGVVDKDVRIEPTSVTADQWIHLAATYDNGVTTLYFNGDLLGVHADTRLFGNDSVNNRLVIGGRLGGSNNEQANGLIDGLRVYNNVLSDQEIRAAAAASVSAVPEPAVMLLGLVGAPLLALARRRSPRSTLRTR